MSTASALAKLKCLRLKSRLLRVIREFFYKHNFIEVDTPVRIKYPTLEEYIDAEQSGELFLRTSPELHMKRLVQAGLERVFQIGPCFRRGERSNKHRPEFTMLEWYSANADYRDILLQTQSLLQYISQKIYGHHEWTYQDQSFDLRSPWNELTVKEAFARHAGVELESALAEADFDLVLVEKIEPTLGIDKPTFLIDYPIQRGALARAKPSDPQFAERWELYITGLELANAYSELTDVEEQRRRFESCARSRQKQNREVYPTDIEFLDALKDGLPECAGCALGVDRLLMILADCRTIDEVMFFE